MASREYVRGKWEQVEGSKGLREGNMCVAWTYG